MNELETAGEHGRCAEEFLYHELLLQIRERCVARCGALPRSPVLPAQ